MDRRARLADLLRSEMGGALSFELPNGGTAIWARVAPDVCADAWSARAAALSGGAVVLQTAKMFAYDGKSRPFLRLGFAQQDEREMREAVRRMSAALATARSTA